MKKLEFYRLSPMADFLYTLFIVFFSVGASMAQEMPVPSQSGFPGAEFTRNEVFIGSALFGLINGGAEQYLEYGFDRMTIQEIEWKGEEFRLELYRMNDPVGAYGIYSVSRHGCNTSGIILEGDCQNKYQYQFSAGNYYLSLINYSGSKTAHELSVKLGSDIASKIGNVDFSLPELFSSDIFTEFIPHIKVVRGIIGLQNVVPSIIPAFSGLDDYTVYYLELPDDNQKVVMALIESGPSWNAGEKELNISGSGMKSVKLNEKQQLLIKSSSGGELPGSIMQLIGQ